MNRLGDYRELMNKVKHEIRTPENDYLFKKEWTETCEKINKLLGSGNMPKKRKKHEKGVIHVPNRSLKGSALV